MKLSRIFAVGGALVTAAAFAIFTFLAIPQQPSIASAAEPPPPINQREAQYQVQIAEANRLLVERQTIYAEQVKELSTRIASASAHLDELTAQEGALTQQLEQLRAARAQRLNSYEQQLSAAKTEYAFRFEQLQAELQTAQTQLAEANSALGR
jgi:DNA repair exonuclease SbcCD ATPase subunit